MAFEVLFAGRVIGTETVPLAQETVFVNPVMVGFAAREQLVAWATWAVRVVFPHLRPRRSGRPQDR